MSSAPTIDLHSLSPGRNPIPAGTTIDGNGDIIHIDDISPAFLELGDDCTVKNVTLLGHKTDAVERDGRWDYPDNRSAWHEDSVGIWVQGDNVTIENVTCTGFTHAGIAVGENNGDTYTNVTIRNSSLVDNNCRALGYGVVVMSGYPTIDGCYFDNNRHDVAADGARNCGYEVRNCEFGPRGRFYGIEMHEPGGDSVSIHHNTFADKRNAAGNRRSLIVNRGTPLSTCTVSHNWFKGALTTSLLGNSPTLYEFTNNHEGPTRPPADVGRPRPSSTPLEQFSYTPGTHEALVALAQCLDDLSGELALEVDVPEYPA